VNTSSERGESAALKVLAQSELEFVAGSTATIKLRNIVTAKSEGRNPKAERNPKPEARNHQRGRSFGFRDSDFFRISTRGFRIFSSGDVSKFRCR
jgi:hypothetical protein